MTSWQLQQAKARLSEVFDRSLQEGPQRITRHGKQAAVLISEETYETLLSANAPRVSIASFLLESPLAGSEIIIDRSADVGREIDLE